MSTAALIPRESYSQRCEAVLRIGKAISGCREPEDLARTLADEIGTFLHFDHLSLLVLKENSKEIESLVWGKGPIALPDLPIEELPIWDAMRSRDPQHAVDWDTQSCHPRFKQWAKKVGLGSGVHVPLTTPHRCLGVFGIDRDTVSPFGENDLTFLRLIGRVAALLLEDALMLWRMQRQHDGLHLLLDLTNLITSNLALRRLLPP